MNVYDFDDTIYDGDTNRDLLKYSFKKYQTKKTSFKEKSGCFSEHFSKTTFEKQRDLKRIRENLQV